MTSLACHTRVHSLVQPGEQLTFPTPISLLDLECVLPPMKNTKKIEAPEISPQGVVRKQLQLRATECVYEERMVMPEMFRICGVHR